MESQADENSDGEEGVVQRSVPCYSGMGLTRRKRMMVLKLQGGPELSHSAPVNEYSLPIIERGKEGEKEMEKSLVSSSDKT